MPEQVSVLFVRLCELAEAEGEVPDDGSGVDGVWSTTVEAAERDRDWNVAVNADTGSEQEIHDFPGEGDSPSLRAGAATVWLGRTPAAVLTPFGGTLGVEQLDDGPKSIEDELIADVEARIERESGGA
jgi:hypothetical protein